MNKITLDIVIDNIQHLPSLPGVVNELILAMGNDNLSIDELAHGIEKDQSLAARALRVANSPFYGRPAQVSSIHDAIVILGFRAVSSLVTTAALTEFFKVPSLNWFDQASFWRHSLGTAVCARKLAGLAGLDPEIGFTAGLLHDIGRLLLVICFAEQYEAVTAWRIERDAHYLDAERDTFGITHTQAGQALAGHWRFAPDILTAIADHHEPRETGPAHYADLIHLADQLAHGLDLARDPRALSYPLSVSARGRLRLAWADIAAILPSIEAEFSSYDSLLADQS